MPTVMELLQKYYDEAHGGLTNDTPPSQLRCGEGTQADYFLLKIDLCKSTAFIRGKRAQTYLKMAHVFLSTVDDITRRYGADGDQVEYAGDSVVAYFSGSTDAVNVLKAATFSREAASLMSDLDPAFKLFPFQTRIVLHYGTLIVAKIGPRGDRKLVAIGPALHTVGHLEKKVDTGKGWATSKFGEQLPARERNLLLSPEYSETVVSVPIPAASAPPLYGVGFLYNPQQLSAQPVLSRTEIKRELVGYSIRWKMIERLIQTGKL